MEPATNIRLSCTDFVKFMEPIKDTTVEISFSLRGDAFSNREIYDMIAYCRDNNIGTAIPTNFSYKMDDATIERIVDSGLDHIIVALDGTTQEVYEMYRKGGRLDWVLDNCKRLIEFKRKKGSKTPLVECKFITFTHNEHQFEDAKQLSQTMGFDRFSTVLDHHHPQRKKEMQQKLHAPAPKKQPCYWAYQTSVICCDGKVYPCCNDRFDMGNAITDGLLNVWNNERYQALRTMFATGEPTEASTRFCVGCHWFWASPLLEPESVTTPMD